MKTWQDRIRHPYTLVSAGLLIAGGAVIAGSQNLGKALAPQNYAPVLHTASLGTAASPLLREEDQALTQVVQTVEPGVVSIEWHEGANAADADPSLAPREVGGSGTGFVYRSNGWIVTNEHVVSGHDTVDVTLADGHKYKGKVTVANDPQYDLAVVKIDASDLPTLDFADSDSVKPGQLAIAIGSPFDLKSSVTFGHISATGRPGQVLDRNASSGMRTYSGLIQTDAAINPGNSGGPLLNIDGQVVGVNSMIYSGQDAMMGASGSVGVGFAISANVAHKVADMLIDKGHLERAFLGAAPQSLTPYEAQQLGIPGGAVLKFFGKVDSPAKAAGLKDGDVVTSLDHKPVKNEMDIRLAMIGREPGSKVDVTYLRDKQEKSATVTLSAVPVSAKAPEDVQPQGAQDGTIPPDMRDFFKQFPNPGTGNHRVGGSKGKLGATVNELDASTRAEFKVPADVHGVVVMGFADGSIAQDAGLKVGDVITSIDGKPVNSIDDLKADLTSVSGTVKIEATSYANGQVTRKLLTIALGG